MEKPLFFCLAHQVFLHNASEHLEKVCQDAKNLKRFRKFTIDSIPSSEYPRG